MAVSLLAHLSDSEVSQYLRTVICCHPPSSSDCFPSAAAAAAAAAAVHPAVGHSFNKQHGNLLNFQTGSYRI